MRWIGRLLIAWVGWKLFTRARIPRFPEPQTHPLRKPGRTVFIGDIEFFVRESGPEDAPPIVLIHGWGDHSLVVFHELLRRLTEDFRVIAPDLRNTGHSDAVREPYEISEVADEVAALIAALDLGPVPVVGYSMGGMVAQELAHRHPGVVSRLVLAGTVSEPLEMLPFPTILVRPAVAAARALERLDRNIISAVRTHYLLRTGALRPEHARWAWSQHAGRDPDLYWEAALAISRWGSSGWISDVDVPTLVIVNTEDELVRPRAQYALAARIPGVQVVEAVGARHAGPLSHADRYRAAIADFVS